MGFEIEQILHISKAELEPLRVASLAEGFAHIEVLLKEWEAGTNRFSQPGESLWGAYMDEELVGICGLNVDPFAKSPDAGRLRRLYVLPVRRREGVGRALVHVVVGKAMESFTHINLHTSNPAAGKFYERLGFHAVEGEEHISYRLVFQKSSSSANASG